MIGPMMSPNFDDNHHEGDENYSGPNLLTTQLKSKRLQSK